MPKAAWRCSQCGTVNEAAARACRQCGKWPSLFDLQDSVAENEVVEEADFTVETFEPDVFEAETFEPEPFETETFGAPEEETAEPKRRFPGWLITVAVIVGWFLWYILGTWLMPD